MTGTLSVDAELVQCFAFYAAIVLFKVFLMAPLTVLQRFKTKTFANSEDASSAGPSGSVGVSEDVERVRRAHLNDLENIVPFVLIGLLYVFAAQPSLGVAKLHFQIFTVARILHTIVYVGQVPQPARGIAFFAGMIVCVSMLLQIIF